MLFLKAIHNEKMKQQQIFLFYLVFKIETEKKEAGR